MTTNFGWSLPPGVSWAMFDAAMGCETSAEEDERLEREEEEEREDDGYCDHGIHEDNHHGCTECAMERAEAMADMRREGS